MGRLKKSVVEGDIVLDNVEPIKDETVEKLSELEVTETELIPCIHDKEWHEYVMKQFTDDELIKGNPTTDGVRRVVEKLIGEIVEADVSVIEPAHVFNNKLTPVTVKYTVKVKSRLSGDLLIYSDVADVSEFNTPPEFARHPAATASTRAEGRALRKILKLRKIVVAEEANAPPIEEVTMYDKIRDDQINFIDTLCNRNQINVMKYVNSGSKVYTNIKDVPFDKAVEMLAYLSKLQQQFDKIPEEIKGYDPEWKTKTNVKF